jgi:solute:Na+ symporter, SSS family
MVLRESETLRFCLTVLLLLVAIPDRALAEGDEGLPVPAIDWDPARYVCHRVNEDLDRDGLKIDGRLDEESWTHAVWTTDFVDIQGPSRPTPRWRTRAKMLWTDEYLYVAIEMEDPHVWATKTKRDSYIFHTDNDIEVFIDPDGDTHDYFELELNSLGTPWDLFLERPYRDGGPAHDEWNMLAKDPKTGKNLEIGVRVQGTFNDPSDRDQGWTVEIAIPFKPFGDRAGCPLPPRPGDQWRLNFSRVQWQTKVEGDRTVRVTDPATGEPLPEDNWVWSPQGLINMHYPEMWGFIQFSGERSTQWQEKFRERPSDRMKWALRRIYYQQRNWRAEHGRFATAEELPEPVNEGLPEGWSWPPVIETTPDDFEVSLTRDDDRRLLIRNDGRVHWDASWQPPGNFKLLDWLIVGFVYISILAGVLLTKRYMKSVADFLAAGRTAGRYMLSISQGMAALGAITVVANFEGNFEAGFNLSWWGLSMGLVILAMTITGWVTYRFRQTRCLTMAEFFERRYSRRFRIFAGMVAFLAGLINFAIFPAVGARFFIFFVGLPHEFTLLGVTLSTYPVTMIVLLSTALYFVYAGGQVAVMITDFIQGLFANLVFVLVPVFLLLHVGWPRVIETISDRPAGKSLINPFDTGHIENFNFWFFLIGVYGVIYCSMSWQGTAAYNTSAKSAHEAKMGGVLSNWRGIPQGLLMLLVPIIAFTVLRHPDFLGTAEHVGDVIELGGTETLRNQLRVPVTLTTLLPVGLMGAFAAVMLAAFISTHDTYLHSWGSIFIQDVVMPFREKPFTPETHLLVLRLAILGVAIVIFLVSLLFEQSQHILFFFAITGAIFAGGSGAVIIGGLYWKRGTSTAAWWALITGGTIAVSGILIDKTVPDFPVNGQECWAIAMGASTVIYIVLSLLGRRPPIDLDRILHRGKYDVATETTIVNAAPSRGWRIFGMGREFTRGDRILYILTYVWSLSWIFTFIIGTIYCLSSDVGRASWASYWHVYIWIQVAMSIVVIVWFAVGGLRDVRSMTRKLSVMNRDEADDGMVRDEEHDGLD